MAHSLVPNPCLLGTGKNVNLVPKAGIEKRETSLQFCQRRVLIYGLSTVAIGPLLVAENANAAKRRAPPPPTGEKKDPSMGALQAKVLASKKRKEAMKEAVAKLREKGKNVE